MATSQLYAALAKAQAAMKHPQMDSTNPHFKNKYASLMAVREAVFPAMNAQGIAVVQCPISGMVGDKVCAGVRTVLVHESGESIESDLLMPLDKPNAQGVGSAITYGRRYALLAYAGLVGDPDDDGNDASTPPPKPQRAAQAKPDAPSPGQTLLASVKGWSGVDDADLGTVARQVMDKAGVVVAKGSKIDGTGVTKCEMWMNKNTFEELNK